MAVYLVTGVNGFIGSHVAERLLAEGHRVRGLVRSTSDLSFIASMDVELHYGDITDPNSLPEALSGVDLVIHVAGLASDWGPYSLFHKINVEGTMNLAREAERQKVKRFVQISTVAFYGFGHKTAIREEDSFKHTIFPYNESKREAEERLFEFAQNSVMEVTAIRPGNVFGTRDHTFIEKYLDVLKTGKLALVNGGRSKTCPAYIENLVDGIMLACTSDKAPGQAFFITDGLDIDWREFTDTFADALGVKRPRLSAPFGLVYGLAWLMETVYKILRIKTAPLLTRYRICNGGKDYVFSIEKARQIIGYQPRVNFKDAVTKTVDWYLNRDEG